MIFFVDAPQGGTFRPTSQAEIPLFGEDLLHCLLPHDTLDLKQYHAINASINMKASMISRHDCSTRDLDDPLAPLRQQFDLPQGVIYLDGNSLGARPKAALARAQHVITAEWGTDLIRSWNSAGCHTRRRRLRR